MRIGVNALYLIPGGVGGTESYLRSLLAAMAEVDRSHEWFLITNEETGKALGPRASNFQVLPQSVKAVNRPARLMWEQTSLPGLARDLRLDVLFNPGFTAPFVVPCRQVTVFHDLQHKRHPEYFRWFDLPAWRMFLYWSARRSDRIIAVSEATRADLRRFYPWLAPERIAVVPHGVGPEFHELAARRDPQPFVLCVSTLHPHKNIVRLVRAFTRVRPEMPGFRLVIAGLRGFHTEAVERAVAGAGGDAVTITGWIPKEELLRLYRTAWSCVYPSTFEGFGMPVLEAMAAGVPLAASGIEPMKSIAGDAGALLFDPFRDDAIEDALIRIVTDEAERARLAEAGSRRAREFTWRATAERTLDVLVRTAI